MSVAHVSSSPLDGPKKSSLFAVIIGINLYKSTSFKTLRGAVPDALAFKTYFEEYLQVPHDQIPLLLNDNATRSNIIKAFKKLATDHRIQKGDPIVIYYAGHGSEMLPTPSASSAIQMLVPHDYSSLPGQEVPTITDRQIEKLIGNIAAGKGDNITVIFDCCHSASGTRGQDKDDPTTLVRSVEIDLASFNLEVDQDLLLDLGLRGGESQSNDVEGKLTNQLRPAGLQSHMLIAACGALELAKEINGRGNFSTAFLNLLRTHSPDKLRYCDILTQMDAISGQNPQCEGRNQYRLLFDAKVAHPSHGFPISVKQIDARGAAQLSLEAGSAQGITVGAEFAVFHANDAIFNKRLALITIITVAAFSALTDYLPDFSPTEPCVAVQTKAGQKEKEDFRLFIPPGDDLHALYMSVQDDKRNAKCDLHNITLVDNPTIAHLQGTMVNNEVIFEMMDKRVTGYGFTRQFESVDATNSEEIAWVLSRIAHFYRELNRANSNPKVADRIGIEFYKLEESTTDPEEWEPVGPNLCQNHTIDFVIEDVPYGIKLINNSKHNLYPYLFYFDNTDLSIMEYYQSASHATPYDGDFPLRQTNGTLSLGYGFGGGVDPFCYDLKDMQDLDVGFLKLFVSSKPIDLGYIPQPSPFEQTRGNKKWDGKKEAWDTVLITMVQRRYPVNDT